jgi:hypothetical protein
MYPGPGFRDQKMHRFPDPQHCIRMLIFAFAFTKDCQYYEEKKKFFSLGLRYLKSGLNLNGSATLIRGFLKYRNLPKIEKKKESEKNWLDLVRYTQKTFYLISEL